MKVSLVALAVFAALLGCNRATQSKDAIRQGVIDHLSTRAGLDVKAMQIDISSVTFRQNEADAVVSFRAKGSNDPASGMQMAYKLELKGNRWVVKGRQDAGGSPHGGGAAMPGAQMPIPPGHPPMSPKASPGTAK